MQTSQKTIVAGILFFGMTCLIAVWGYWLAGWDLLDAAYMVTITVYGVGYGEVRAVTDPRLKLFTMGVVIAGCTSAIYVFGGFVQYLVEGEFNRYVGARRMKSEIGRLEGHVVLCGFGRVGLILARELHANQHAFVIVDSQEARIKMAKEHGYLAVLGNATSEETLIEAGIMRAESLAAVLSDDVINVFVTLTAKELRPEIEIFARAENPTTEKKLKTSGANQVVLPAAIGARRIAEALLSLHREKTTASKVDRDTLPTVSSLESIGLVFHRCPIEGGLVGLTLRQVEQRISQRFLSIELTCATGEHIQRPLPDQVLHDADSLMILGPEDVLQKFELIAAEKNKMMYRGASR